MPITRDDIQTMKELCARLGYEKVGHRVWPIDEVDTADGAPKARKSRV